MTTASEIIDLWPSASEFARRLGEKPVVAQRWKMRGRIPGKYDTRIVKLAKAEGKPVTYEMLALSRSSGHKYQNGPAPDESQDKAPPC